MNPIIITTIIALAGFILSIYMAGCSISGTLKS